MNINVLTPPQRRVLEALILCSPGVVTDRYLYAMSRSKTRFGGSHYTTNRAVVRSIKNRLKDTGILRVHGIGYKMELASAEKMKEFLS